MRHTCRPFRFRVLLLGLILVYAPGQVSVAQTIPGDFALTASAGGALPGGAASKTITVEIASDGSGTFHQYRMDPEAAGEQDPTSFTLSPDELHQLWEAVASNGFFSLDAVYVQAAIRDRTVAHLTITADGSTHMVTTRNVAVAAFDAVIDAVNAVTPEDANLVYDVSEPGTFVMVPVCEQAGKAGISPENASWTDGKTPRLSRIVVSAPASTREPAPDAVLPHPGTVVAYRAPLAEAVERGIAELSAKGVMFGDAVRIDVDNTTGVTTDDLRLNLYLEFWGEGASHEIAAIAESGIESAWSGTTSGGKDLVVDVITRVRPGGSGAPGTPGFHQIEITTEAEHISHVSNRMNDTFGVNHGVGMGAWSTEGADLDILYAHEAGHLFGINDRYSEYHKHGDMWRLVGDPTKAPLTDEQLAEEIGPRFPDRTAEEVLEYVKSGNRRTAPLPGHEFDLMARWREGVKVRQSDIDALAALAGLLVEVKPGDPLLNMWGRRQDMAIMRAEDVFAPAGEAATLEGLYAACIDRASGIPVAGDIFDLAPPLSAWNGVKAAPLLLQLLQYMNDEERFCPADAFYQSVVWRLTNNAGTTNPNITEYLADAGIDVGYRELDFPSLSNPNAIDAATGLSTPPELFVPRVTSPAGDVVAVVQPISFEAGLETPFSNDEGIAPEYLWFLDRPEGSAAALEEAGETATLTPDLRGVYDLELRAVLPDSLTGASGDGTFTSRTTMRFVAVDSLVETFESGELATGAPFFWETGSASWVITDKFSHTGAYSLRSGPIGDNASSTLRARFDQLEPGHLSFAHRMGSHFSDSLFFTVDGVVHERFSGADPWTIITVDLPAGLHTVTWSYVKDGSDSIGADRAWLDDVFFPATALITSIDDGDGDVEEAGLPTSVVRLGENVPNPFSAGTTIDFELPRPGPIDLVVYDALGRRVAVLASGIHAAGTHRIRFDAAHHAGGIYYYQLRTGRSVRTRPMVIMR